MESSVHILSELFRQLGLPDDGPSIERFIVAHRPIEGSIRLADASFWSTSQTQFLRGEIAEDADWAEVVDALDSRLRA